MLDALRGLAALYVVVNLARGWVFAGGAEYTQHVPRSEWGPVEYLLVSASQLTRLGTEFVIVFFVLSGFSITYSLSRTDRMRSFYLRRVVRLYPPYVIGLAWAGIVFLLTRALRPDFYACRYDTQVFHALCASEDFLSLPVILSNLAYLPRGALISQYWSLTHEVVFYALVPLYFVHRRTYLFVSAGLYLADWIVDGVGLQSGHTVLVDHVLVYNAYFAAGVLLHGSWRRALERLVMPLWLVGGVAGASFFAMVALNFSAGEATKATALLAAAVTVLLVVNGHAHDVHVRPLEFVGRFSYTLYVTHLATVVLCVALIHSATPLEPPDILQPWIWVLVVPVAVGVGYILCFAGERWSKQMLWVLRGRTEARQQAGLDAEIVTAP